MNEPAASFERINYSTRPAKATQRHMLAEVIGRLGRFAPLSEYQYIGFGSTFFVDFRLLHQRFGISTMYSIEIEEEKRKRFDFNVPYQSVKMLYGDSKDMLLDPRIKWERAPAIVWLDYDLPLDRPKLGDCERVLRRALHGSMLLVTFSGEVGRIRGRLDRVRAWLEDYVGPDEDDETLSSNRYLELGLDALTENADVYLEETGNAKVFQQLFRFRYADGSVPMATWGGLILDRDRQNDTKPCKLDKLPYVVEAGGPSVHIEIPNLTPIERALAETYLPNRPGLAKRVIRGKGIPEDEIDRLASVYRYAPRFVETFA